MESNHIWENSTHVWAAQVPWCAPQMGKYCSLLHSVCWLYRGMSALDSRWHWSFKFQSSEAVMSPLQAELWTLRPVSLSGLMWLLCRNHCVLVHGSCWVHSVLPATLPKQGLDWALAPEPADHVTWEGGHQPCSAHRRLDHSKKSDDISGSSVGWCSRQRWGFGARRIGSGQLLAIQAMIVQIQPVTHIQAASLVLHGAIN